MRHMFELSAETQRVHQLFREMKIDETVTFDRASKALGFTIDASTPAYQSAKRIALRDDGIVIEGVRGVGFTRLNGTGMVKKGYGTMRSIRRKARRGAAVTEVAIRQNLTKREMLEATEQLSRFRIIETTGRITAPKSNREVPEKPPIAEKIDNRQLLKNLK